MGFRKLFEATETKTRLGLKNFREDEMQKDSPIIIEFRDLKKGAIAALIFCALVWLSGYASGYLRTWMFYHHEEIEIIKAEHRGWD